MSQDVKSKKDWLKYAKIFCLLTPTIISLIILILVGVIVFGRYFSPYTIEMRVLALEVMIPTIFTLIGVAVTVWIALNIYNIISKDELDIFKEDTSKKIDEITFSYENKLKELYESIDEKFNKKIKDYHIKENEEINNFLKLYNDEMSLENLETLLESLMKKSDRGDISRALASIGSMEIGLKIAQLKRRKQYYDKYFEIYNRTNIVGFKKMSINDLKLILLELGELMQKLYLEGLDSKNKEFLLTEEDHKDFRELNKCISTEISERSSKDEI